MRIYASFFLINSAFLGIQYIFKSHFYSRQLIRSDVLYSVYF